MTRLRQKPQEVVKIENAMKRFTKNPDASSATDIVAEMKALKRRTSPWYLVLGLLAGGALAAAVHIASGHKLKLPKTTIRVTEAFGKALHTAQKWRYKTLMSTVADLRQHVNTGRISTKEAMTKLAAMFSLFDTANMRTAAKWELATRNNSKLSSLASWLFGGANRKIAKVVKAKYT